jgi:Rrf2 family transcriptional regulator, nitric oxide-sensitive transcriptional repressor
MLSQTAEYSLRAIVFLADHHGTAMTAGVIAEHTKVPLGYLAKILQGLARDGLVISQRGLHGGFTLMRSPSDVTIFDVVQAVDPIPRIHTCPLGLPNHGSELCPLHRRLDSAALAIETAFKRTTIAQLLIEPGDSRPLCAFPSTKDKTTVVEPAKPANSSKTAKPAKPNKVKRKAKL